MINRRKKIKTKEPDIFVYSPKVGEDTYECIGKYNQGMPLPRVGEFIYDSKLEAEFYIESIRHVPEDGLIIVYVRDNS